jgi:DMSO/TMAO reductase YedYZ molybdopterin-dependent catalytic subunit
VKHQPLCDLRAGRLRLRVENQLGFKMVKSNKVIEVVAGLRSINKGEGGHAEDQGYFGELARTCCRAGRGWEPCRERNMAWNWA